MVDSDRSTADHCPTIVIAVPVRDEEKRIARCLQAFAAQEGVDLATLGVVLFINNSTDRTTAVVTSERDALPFTTRVVVRDDPMASAGWARRKAMELAAEWLDEGRAPRGVLLTKDADSCVPPEWLHRNLAALAAGADAVAGSLALDPEDAARLPPSLHARGRLEARYEALLTEIVARIDSEPGNPWSTHWCTSGASIAVTLAAYEAVGGMPPVPCGEDRFFVDQLKRAGLVVRHNPAIVVETSARARQRRRRRHIAPALRRARQFLRRSIGARRSCGGARPRERGGAAAWTDDDGTCLPAAAPFPAPLADRGRGACRPWPADGRAPIGQLSSKWQEYSVAARRRGQSGPIYRSVGTLSMGRRTIVSSVPHRDRPTMKDR